MEEGRWPSGRPLDMPSLPLTRHLRSRASLSTRMSRSTCLQLPLAKPDRLSWERRVAADASRASEPLLYGRSATHGTTGPSNAANVNLECNVDRHETRCA